MKSYFIDEQDLLTIKELSGNKNVKNDTTICGCINTFLEALINQTLKINSPKPILIKNGFPETTKTLTVTGKGKAVFYSRNSGGNSDVFAIVVVSVDNKTFNTKVQMDRTGRCEIEFKKNITLTYPDSYSYYETGASLMIYLY